MTVEKFGHLTMQDDNIFKM